MSYLSFYLALAALIGGFVSWIATRWYYERQKQNERIAHLERQVSELIKPRRFWYDEGRMDERVGLLAAAQLMKLSVHDGLDALRRLSPGLAEEVVEDVMGRPSK